MKKKVDLGICIIHFIIILIVVITLFPFFNVAAISLSSDKAVRLQPFMIFPRDVNVEAYRVILTHKQLFSAYRNTILVATLGTALGILITMMAAYALSRPDFPLKKHLMIYFVITMYISGGMVPGFMLVCNLKLYDTLWALIIPGCMSVYNLILMKNFFQSDEIHTLSEAAKVDGGNDPIILFRIVIPASLASVSTIALFYLVGHWNSFMNAVLYTRSNENWTLQLLLREIILAAEVQMMDGYDIQVDTVPFMNVKCATMLVAVLPVLFVYPFIQKYFVKGVMIGAVKG